MKKSLAIICAIAVLISALGGTFLLSSATDAAVATVVMPSFAGKLTIGEKAGAPVYVTSNQPFNVIENRSGLPLANLFECANDGTVATGWLKGTLNFQPNVDAKGMMFYLEVHESSPVMPYFIFYAADGKKFTVATGGGTCWYTLSEGDTEWQTAPITLNHTPLFAAGFKGYVYVPYDVKSISRNGSLTAATVTASTPLAYMTIELCGTQKERATGYLPVGESFVMSAPMWVTSVDANGMIPADKVMVDGVEYTYFETADAGVASDKYGLDKVSIVNPVKHSKNGVEVFLTAGEALNTSAVSVGNVDASVVEAVGGVVNYPAVKVSAMSNFAPGNTIISWKNLYNGIAGETANGSTALMFYIKNTTDSVLPIALNGGLYSAKANDNTTDSRWAEGDNYANFTVIRGKVYLLDNGETSWTELANNGNYYFDIPAGFDGYVKFGYDDVTFTHPDVDKWWNYADYGISAFDNFYIQGKAAGTAEKPVYFGQPLYVYQEGETNQCIIGQIKDLTTGNQLSTVRPKDETADDDDTSSDDTSSDDTSSGGSSDDTSSDDTSSDDTSSGGSSDDTSSDGSSSGGNDDTPVQPDYKLPAYTGATIDYSKFSIQNVTIAKLNGIVAIGGAVDKVSMTAPAKDEKGIPAGTITAVDSIIGITKYPSFKVNKKGGTYDDWANYVAFSHDTSVTKGAVELLHYIKLPAGKSAQFCTQYNFTKNGDASATPYAAYIVNGKASIMSKGQKEWTTVDVKSYMIDLPAGFEGYIKYSLNNLYVTYGGNKNEFAADQNKELTNTLIFLFGVEATDDVYMTPTIVVTKGGSVPYAAFVDGETNAARNIFTGAVLTKKDLSGFEGVEGSENLNQSAAPAIDYKIPAYKGAAETYGNYLFSRVKQFALGANVAKGYVIPQNAFSDGHPDKNNNYTKLIDTTIGISKMPLFAITKTTGSPAELEGEPSVSVANWLIDHTVEAHTKCGAVMQYIKVPSDLEKVFCGIHMNAYDKDMRRKNIPPYSGTVYYMQKGTTEWQTSKISAYWFELPKGFEGYVMLETAPLRAQSNGGDWAEDWSIYNFNLRIANLKNQTVIASAPFWLDSKGDIDYAAYINDETKIVRNIFTGKTLKKADVIKPLVIGDTLVKLPDYTTDFSAVIANTQALSSGTAEVEWDSIDNAVKYIVRVFKKVNTDDGIAYNYVAMAETTDTKATITDLELNTQYAIVVYAYNANNDEIAVFDYINANTAAGVSTPSKPTVVPGTPSADDNTEEGANVVLIIVIIAAVVVVLAAAAVATVIVIKKRKANAEADITTDADTDALN